MGLRERLNRNEAAAADVADDVPVVVSSAWVTWPDLDAPTTLALQALGDNGYGLRHPDTGEAISTGDDYLKRLGGVVTPLEEIGPRRDDARALASAPGQVLSLVPESQRVAVYDRTGRHDVGYLDDDLAAAVQAAFDTGVELRALSLWETTALDGQRTELRILIVPSHVRLTIGDGHRIDLTAR